MASAVFPKSIEDRGGFIDCGISSCSSSKERVILGKPVRVHRFLSPKLANLVQEKNRPVSLSPPPAFNNSSPATFGSRHKGVDGNLVELSLPKS